MATAFEEVIGIREGFSGLPPPQPGEAAITGSDPVFSTRFKIGETCAAGLGGVGVAVSDIWEIKTGRRLKLSIDARHAAAGLRSSTYLQRPGADGVFKPVVNKNHEAMRAITQPWPTKDGRWVLPHFGLPNLQARMLKLLGCEPNPESVAKAVAKWDAPDLEAAIDEARVCGGMVRSSEEWLAHPHGQVLSAKPVVEIIRIGESDPEPLPKGGRPLSGIRALDLTRILAGPIAARTLAEHGADVLMVTAERLPQIPEQVAFPGLGLDLSDAELDAIRIESRPRSGPLRHLGPILKFSEAQPHWTRPTPQLGGDAPEWLEFGDRAA